MSIWHKELMHLNLSSTTTVASGDCQTAEPGVFAHTCNSSTWWVRGGRIDEFKAILGYLERSKVVRDIQQEPVFKKEEKRRHRRDLRNK